MKRSLLIVWFILPWILWMLLMFAMSSQLGGTQNSLRLILAFLHIIGRFGAEAGSHKVTMLDLFLRKGAHLTEYFILTLLGFRAMLKGCGKHYKNAITISFWCSIIFAVTDESHQYFVPGRTAQFRDWLVDFCGVTLCAVVINWKYKRSVQKMNPSAA